MRQLPGYRYSIEARWGRRSSPPGCWPRPLAAPTPAGKAPGPTLKRTSRTTERKRRTMRTTDGWKTWCCFCKIRGQRKSVFRCPAWTDLFVRAGKTFMCLKSSQDWTSSRVTMIDTLLLLLNTAFCFFNEILLLHLHRHCDVSLHNCLAIYRFSVLSVCVSYLDLRPLESEAVVGVRVWVRVEARAEEEYPVLSRDRANSLPSWKSLFLMAS